MFVVYINIIFLNSLSKKLHGVHATILKKDWIIHSFNFLKKKEKTNTK